MRANARSPRRRAAPRRRRARGAASARSLPRSRARGRRARCASAAARRAACRRRCAVARVVQRLARARGASSPALPDTQSRRVWWTIVEDRAHAAALLAEHARAGCRGTRPRTRRSSGCRACPSGAGCGTGCACRRAGQRGTRKQERPRSVCASVRKASRHRRRAEPLVADQLVLRPGPPAERVRARRVRAHVAAALLLGHRHPDRAPRLLARPGRGAARSSSPSTRGSHSAAISGSARSAGTHAKVIVSGQHEPASTWREQRVQRGCARRSAPGRGSRHGRLCTSCAIASAITACQAGWNSTSSMRWPKRSCVRSSGVWRFASRPSASTSRCPSARRRRARARPPSRRPRARGPRGARVGVEQVDVLERRRLVLDLVRRAAQLRRAGIAHVIDPANWRTRRTARGRALSRSAPRP